ncbi:alpha/beta fold hydrolase [uncultured Cohaesibacter sp.]|uniref:alpha/beta hydrolase n=1 Tax=uncultured Cohaesibacter sp. TaxID=1002546 RepID=UPI0029C75E85|nr:alpha/beta fold hydrolase [uncultured Cohaesibacter sp.]
MPIIWTRRILSLLLPRRVKPAPYVLLVCALLTACSTPTGIKFTSGPLIGQDIETVLVATTRAPNGRADYSGDRDGTLHLMSYGISIPPIHKIGQIEWPKGAPDPKRHFAVASADPFATPAAFQASLGQMADAAKGTGKGARRSAALFVHGYNTDFSESLYRAAQLRHDFGLKMPLTLFSWPSAGEPGLYIYDRDSVKTSRDQLASLIRLMVKAPVDDVTLIAHSLGSELLMETLRQLALENRGSLPSKIRSVILISPDLDIDVFNAQLNVIKTLPPEFAIFASQKDKALQLSSFLAGDRNRVGNNIDETKILRAGITVFDVSDFTGGDGMNHMTAVTSPSLVALLKGMTTTNQRVFLQAPGEKTTFSDVVVDTATLPLTLVVKTTSAILQQ